MLQSAASSWHAPQVGGQRWGSRRRKRAPNEAHESRGRRWEGRGREEAAGPCRPKSARTDDMAHQRDSVQMGPVAPGPRRRWPSRGPRTDDRNS
eukprot:9493387-Pyramimonas_sp.AAC.6